MLYTRYKQKRVVKPVKVVEETTEAVNYDELTVDELKTELDKLGFSYKKKDTKATLLKLLKGEE